MSAHSLTAGAIQQAQSLFQQNQPKLALKILRAAEAAGAKEAAILLNIGVALRMMGDFTGALGAVERALAIDPYDFLALLSKGKLLELLGRQNAAAKVYVNALKIMPPEERLPPPLKSGVTAARAVVAARNSALADHLRKATEPVKGAFSGENFARFDECLDIFSGLKKAFVHEPLLLNFPRLPAIPFFDRAHFPWLAELEAAAPDIREELMRLLREDQQRFRPYIQFPPGAPVNQWVDLNHSPSWSTLFLWENGEQNQAICAKCPTATALLSRLPMAVQPGLAPTAMFSALAPRTRIPAHTGSTNARSIVHLPLVLPSNCRFRVGNETRDWRMDEAWVFDDSIEHEAWNDSDELRVILIFDIWNPLLSEAERALVTALLTAERSFGGN